MELVVDANVLLASFLKEGTTRALLLDTRLKLYAPEHLISEISRHLEETATLRNRIGLSAEEILGLFRLLTNHIQTVPKESYKKQMSEALNLAPHEEDAPYLAVALLLNIPIWSSDRGLREQNEVQVYSTPQIIALLENR